MYIMSNRTGSCAEARRGLAFARLMSVTDVQSSQLPTLLNAKPLRGTRYKYPSSLQLNTMSHHSWIMCTERAFFYSSTVSGTVMRAFLSISQSNRNNVLVLTANQTKP